MRSNTDLHLLLASLALLCGPALAADPPPASVIVAPARQIQFADSIEALGTVAARESVALTATVTETVSALHFDDGDRVEKGQPLAEIEQPRGARPARGSARHGRAKRCRQYQRFQSLAGQGHRGQIAARRTPARLETARARLARSSRA
jgi:membrane fusion protein (multidrug efflux system)